MIRKQDDPVGSMFHDIAHLIRHKIDDVLRPYELTRLKWLAIGIISDNEGLTQSGLANRLELKNAATGKLVDRLVERGLVERMSDPQDRRVYRLHATVKSRALLAELEPLGGAVRESVLDGIGEEDLQVLKKLLHRIKTNLTLGLASLATPYLTNAELAFPLI